MQQSSYTADQLAQSFSRDTDASPEQAQLHLQVAMIAAESLALDGHPGRWDQLDLSAIYAGIRFMGEQQLGEVTLVLAGMLQWMGLTGRLHPQTVLGYLDEMAECAPKHDLLHDYIATNREQMARLLEQVN